ncbi:MAG TPA: sugar ABC transporter permease [Acetobacteraceae bacterium]|nr:sugar ABC transporter permease [Acetobacteraceae bacterium]
MAAPKSATPTLNARNAAGSDVAPAARVGLLAVRRRRRRYPHALAAYLFLAPFLVLFVMFLVGPLFYALNLSVWRETLVGGRSFAGLANYADVFADESFWRGIRNMLLFGVFQVPIMLGLALIFALVLDAGTTYAKSLFRIGFFLPYAVPSVIAALIWGYLYGPSFGPFTQAANALGWAPPMFLSRTLMLPSLANIVTWEFTGYNMIILYSALQAVPKDVIEAAAIDGARPIRVARSIRVPLIAPTIVLTAIFSVIGTLQLFNEPQLMLAIAPDVIGNDYTPNIYAYTTGFVNQQYNYAAAISFVLGAFVVIISYAVLFFSNRRQTPAAA